jgi:hypothetical protein
MATISAELVSSDERRDSRGRKLVGDARRQAVLAAFDRAGVTQREFARREGVNYHTLVTWLDRRRRKAPPAVQPPIRFAELQMPVSARTPGLEVCLPGGVIVRGGDVAQVAALVKALR